MKNLTLLLLFISLVFACSNGISNKTTSVQDTLAISKTTVANPSYLVTDADIYDFINFLIKECDDVQMKNQYGYVAEDSREGNYFFSEDSLRIIKSKFFTREDIRAFYQQTRERENFKLEPSKIHIFKVIPASEMNQFAASPDFWESYHKYYHSGFCSYSLPLFSKDMKTVIIKNKCLFDGLGGFGEMAIYQKYGKSWKKIKVLSYWES